MTTDEILARVDSDVDSQGDPVAAFSTFVASLSATDPQFAHVAMGEGTAAEVKIKLKDTVYLALLRGFSQEQISAAYSSAMGL